MTDDTTTDRIECYVCGEDIQPTDWVIPLETYTARYRDSEFVLNADNKRETVLHAECLRIAYDEVADR